MARMWREGITFMLLVRSKWYGALKNHSKAFKKLNIEILSQSSDPVSGYLSQNTMYSFKEINTSTCLLNILYKAKKQHGPECSFIDWKIDKEGCAFM